MFKSIKLWGSYTHESDANRRLRVRFHGRNVLQLSIRTVAEQKDLDLLVQRVSDTEFGIVGCGSSAVSGFCSRITVNTSDNSITIPGIGRFVRRHGGRGVAPGAVIQPVGGGKQVMSSPGILQGAGGRGKVQTGSKVVVPQAAFGFGGRSKVQTGGGRAVPQAAFGFGGSKVQTGGKSTVQTAPTFFTAPTAFVEAPTFFTAPTAFVEAPTGFTAPTAFVEAPTGFNLGG